MSYSVPALHLPVMVKEVLTMLAPKAGDMVVDGTFGCGGYTRAILDVPDTQVIGIDRDPDAVGRGRMLAKEFGSRFRIVEGVFSQMQERLAEQGVSQVDGIVLDLGVSSPQFDQAERGFSFRADGPLDMRMAQTGMTAADVVATLDEADLADVIWRYGEEKKSRRIAKAIVRYRSGAAIERTQTLAEIVRGAIGYQPGIDPATRTFMALRIYVNDELRELEKALSAMENLVKPNGRIVVVTFHSLEDRIVKAFLSARAKPHNQNSRYLPDVVTLHEMTWRLLTKKALVASDAEIAINPRARSAKLRAAVRCGHGGELS